MIGLVERKGSCAVTCTATSAMALVLRKVLPGGQGLADTKLRAWTHNRSISFRDYSEPPSSCCLPLPASEALLFMSRLQVSFLNWQVRGCDLGACSPKKDARQSL